MMRLNRPLVIGAAIAMVGLLIFICHAVGSRSRAERFTPCRDVLTDAQYLRHMIPHHHVAVDVSIAHAQHTDDPLLANLLRKLIWTQRYEIDLMSEALRRPFADDLSSLPDDAVAGRPLMRTVTSCVPPNVPGLSPAKCDPKFFDPVAHAAHMRHMGPMTDRAYYDHMIPHHQVAVDMSKVLLQSTRSDFLIHLAYRIIRAQEAEIKVLHDMRAALGDSGGGGGGGG